MQRLARRWQGEKVGIGLVPTMGFLHAGHLELVQRARRLVGRGGKVVVSIYVNPTQFGPKEDFSRYPRDFAKDVRLCREEGVDVVFAPQDREMYPGDDAGRFSTFVVEEQMSQGMEGASRPGHFRGVATVVAKLFNIVRPDHAVFGAKDYQQAAVVRRLTRDLNFPVRIDVAATVREPDGLAMSSRNKYLEGDLRTRALILRKAIETAQAAVHQRSAPILAAQLKGTIMKLIGAEPAARLDYVEFFEPATLTPAARVGRGSHMALAVFIGATRLIDKARL
jgi:pantoate--beta-alanine ligase